MTYPAEPLAAKTVAITIADSSDSVELPGGYSNWLVTNLATETVYLALGGEEVAATASATGNLPIPAGVVQMLTIRSPVEGGLYAAAIGTGSTGSLAFTPCLGGI